MKIKKGFTLIEMMVVVLIIAGLAAIAYPAYTKVIMKARIAEAFSIAEIVREAQQRSLAVNGNYFSNFIPAHISGRTRLIKSGSLGLHDGMLLRDNYAVAIANVLETTTTKAVPNGCIIVRYYKDINNLETAPIFTIFTHVEDSSIWCTESDDSNGICGVIPAGTSAATDLDCQIN